MAPKTQDAFEPARQAAEQMTERTQETITNYFGWLQNVMQAAPWGNTELNKKLMSFNEHAKEIGEIYTKVATSATKTPVGMST
jgi:hypothetical protein